MGDGRVVTNVVEVQEDGDELEVVTEYVLLGWTGPDLDLGDLAAEWEEVLAAAVVEEEIDLPDDRFTDVEVEGAHAAVQAFYEGSSAEVLERFETFSFDPDVLMAACEGGMIPPGTLRSEA